MVALVCAYITRQLGVYYLVGAFVVGITAQRLRKNLPAMTSEKMLHAIEVFASFFVPFYFFNAGLHLHAEDFSLDAIIFGGMAFLIVTPLRLSVIALHRKFALGEAYRVSLPIAGRLTPTLVFSLVMASILKPMATTPPFLFGGIVIYALLNTIIPGILLKSTPPAYEAPVLNE